MTQAAITQVFNGITVITNKGQAFLVVSLPHGLRKISRKAAKAQRGKTEKTE
jgi:hypothetical protein